MTEMLTMDELEARAETQRQIAETARRFGFAGEPGITQVGPPPPPIPPPSGMMIPVPQPYTYTEPSVVPQYLPPHPPPIVVSQSEHLLLTATTNAQVVRVVRMSGSTKAESWTLDATAATTLSDIVRSFGITLTDLREEDHPDG